jgi:hypothetical protein
MEFSRYFSNISTNLLIPGHSINRQQKEPSSRFVFERQELILR